MWMYIQWHASKPAEGVTTPTSKGKHTMNKRMDPTELGSHSVQSMPTQMTSHIEVYPHENPHWPNCQTRCSKDSSHNSSSLAWVCQKQLEQDVTLWTIERVPIGTPTKWLVQMNVVSKPDGSPRRTVDLRHLNKHCIRETATTSDTSEYVQDK